MNFTRDEMETMWQVYCNEIARLQKSFNENDSTLDEVIRGFIEKRITILEGIVNKLYTELNKD